MRLALFGTLAVALVLGGCASPMNVLRVTTTGGDALPAVAVSPTGQVDVSSVNIGDTVVFAPGSMRAVAKAPAVTISLVEPKDVTDSAVKKSLSVNRREGAKIDVLKGRLLNGDFFQTGITIDLQSPDQKQYDIDLTLLAFNRGEKAFRGDLTVYDLLPPELEFVGTVPPAKYNDRRGIKDALMALPFVQLFAMAMDNYSRSNETVDMVHDRLGDVHRYTFRRMVLEPGQAVGFVVRTRYKRPTSEELDDLRLQAMPLVGPR